jgi:hypothetical protein
MSLTSSAEVYKGQTEGADRNHRRYALVPAEICIVLALVLTGVIFTPVSTGSGINNEALLVGP